jgi:hypothetical protein
MTPHTAPYCIILSILFLSYRAIHINIIPSPVANAHTFQLTSPPNTPHLSSMSYPADYDGDDPPPHIYDNNDSANEDEDDCGGVGYNDSDDEADCGGVRYNGDGVDKKIPAKRDAPMDASTGNVLSLLIHPQGQRKRPL